MKPQNLILTLIPVLCIGFLPSSQALTPAPDGGYPGGNTAEGQTALFNLTTGGYNTAIGYLSLSSDTTNSFNTAVGAGTLLANNGDQNTATGAGALLSNTIGASNTANGAFALFNNTVGANNTANGVDALLNNTTGNDNTAHGVEALMINTTGGANTATGVGALGHNTTGNFNTAHGFLALGGNTTGNNNVALGALAGQNLTTGSYNIDIGNTGIAGEAGTIRIGDDTHNGATFIAGVYGMAVAGLTVVMDSSDHLGTVASSRRFKKEIKPMDRDSEAILSLKPVSFRYKKEIDPAQTSQFGLIAEEVEKVNPDLVARDKAGKPYSVRYDQVNAMLLNEFLKEHRTVQDLRTTVQKQQAIITDQQKSFESKLAEQQKQIQVLSAGLQKVSAELEENKPAPQIVLNSQ
jgi:Chaperone of endosialidase